MRVYKETCVTRAIDNVAYNTDFRYAICNSVTTQKCWEENVDEFVSRNVYRNLKSEGKIGG